MKIINRQGKLFGLINIIDLGVIIILIAIGYIFFNLARNAQIGYPLIIKIKVLFPGVPMEVIKKMQPGDREGRGAVQANLLRFELRSIAGEGNSQRVRDIYAWFNLSARVKDVLVGNKGEKVASYFYKGEELNIDDPITFNPPQYSLQGILLNIDLMDREIEVILDNNFPKEVTEAIKAGDRISRWEHLVGEVVAKGYTSDGRVKVKLHIKRGEVSIKAGEQFAFTGWRKRRSDTSRGEGFFKVGEQLSFESEEYYVWGIIVKSNPWRQN